MSLPVLLIYRDADRVLPYREAVLATGLRPVVAAPEENPNLEGIHGLVLTGGTDIDPALFGEDAVPETDPPDRARDSVEYELIARAMDLDIPVLAICRGFQILNVWHGGTLVQHIGEPNHHRRAEGDRSLAAHTIEIESGTLLHQVANTGQWQVNSRHHQAVNRLGSKLRVCARDPADGLIEAFDRPDRRFVLAVQWHPEDQLARFPEQRALFQAFATAVTVGPPSRMEFHRRPS